MQIIELCCGFFFNDTATTEIYTLSLHDALPISNFYVSDLEAPDNISIINDEEDLVAGVVAPRIEREVSLDGDEESDEDVESEDEGSEGTVDGSTGGDSSEDEGGDS